MLFFYIKRKYMSRIPINRDILKILKGRKRTISRLIYIRRNFSPSFSLPLFSQHINMQRSVSKFTVCFIKNNSRSFKQ